MSIWTALSASVVPSPSIPVLSVGNLKGGVGKTTVVANLICALALRGMRVLAIDLDFQASLSVALPSHIVTRYESCDGAVSVLRGTGYDMFHDSRITTRGLGKLSNLSLVRTSLALADIEDRMFADFVLGLSKEDLRFALANKLADPRLINDFDIVVIDTAPRLTIGTINALCASTHVLIPTSLTPMAYSGAATFNAFLNEFKTKLCPKLTVLAVLPTLTRSTLNAAEIAFLDQSRFDLAGVDIWRDHFIPRRQVLADNKAYADQEERERFDSLADKIITTLRIGNHGVNASLRSHRRSELNRQLLS